MDDTIWTSIAQIGGTAGIVGFAVRWIYGIERDMVRRYARQTVDLEKQNRRLQSQLNEWRDAYWQLRAGKVVPPPTPDDDSDPNAVLPEL